MHYGLDCLSKFLSGAVQMLMPLTVYGLYVHNGNALDLSSMAMANLMMRKIGERMLQVNSFYRAFTLIDDILVRLNKYYFVPEAQKGLVLNLAYNNEGEFAVKVKGNFTWKVAGKKEDKKDEDDSRG